MIRRSSILLFLIITFHYTLFAQEFGGNPPSLHWLQINNDTVRVIFPAGLQQQAVMVANLAGALSRSTLTTIGHRNKKIDIIFQNQTTIANGFVQLAPFRTEFQLTADQNSFELGSLPWPRQLVIHEYRHVQQYNNFRVGLSKVFYYLSGQSGLELANSLSVPNWFWEGDAVFQETLVSKQGRGRLPAFFNGYRALWSGKKDYSWMKLRNGSLRDFVPDHYPLGYMMVAYAREKFGADIWKKVAGDAAAFKGVFYPLQRGIRKNTGQSFPQFREDALNFFDKLPATNGTPDSSSAYAIQHRHFVADEEFPQFINDHQLVYVRTSYKKVHSIVIRDLKSHQEKYIRTMAVALNNYFSYRNNRMVYAAYEPDIRWGWRDFSVLRIMDLPSGNERKITLQSKYFSPDISEDGLHIAAVKQEPDGSCSLQVLNAVTGIVETAIPNRSRLFYTYPKFFDQKRLVAAIRDSSGQMALGLITMSNGEIEWMTPFSMNVVGFPSVKQDTIFFTASHNGQDQLFFETGKQIFHAVSPMLSRFTGNYQLQARGDQFAWTAFTAVGFKLIVADRSSMEWQPINTKVFAEPLMNQSVRALQQGPVDLSDHVEMHNQSISDYPSFAKLFNFHSWRPYIEDPDYTISLVSNNVLNTLQTEIFFNYNRNEASKSIGVDALYGAWFPWIDGGVEYTFDRSANFKGKRVIWNEAQARIGFSVPLTLSKARWYRSLQFGSDLVYNQPYFTGINKSYSDSFGIKSFAYLNPTIRFSNQSQQARQQINPAWAQVISLNYEHAITQFDAHQFLVSGYFYFPGLIATHSLVITAAAQQRDTGQHVQFTNNFPFSRGYSGENFYQMVKVGLNYHFPIAYPDWGFANILYFLRIRANLFYDFTQANDFYNNGSKFSQHYRSFGTEIYFDTKWWNQLPISFGIRYSRLLDQDFEGRGPNQWQFILPLTLLGK